MSGTSARRRHSPAVYRRRRLVLLIAVLVIAGLVWLLIAQPWRGTAADGGSAAPVQTQDAATDLPVPESTTAADGSASASASASASTETAADPSASAALAAEACRTSDLTVEAVTDSDVYGAGQNPQLSIRLTNTGEADCTLNVGTSTQVFTITSGSDTWWRSTDCQSEPSDMLVVLAAGQTVQSATALEWDRTRSSVSTCGDASRPVAPGGGATYNLTVEIGGASGDEATQFLLY